MKIDLQTLGKSAGVDLKQLMQANQNNPADMLKALKAIVRHYSDYLDDPLNKEARAAIAKAEGTS